MDHEMMNLFAVPVYKCSMNREYTSKETEYFRSELLEPVKAISNYSSPNKNVLAAEAMSEIRSLIQENLDTYLATVYNSSNEVSLEITQSWLSMTNRGGSHHIHSHPNSVLSGVLYIKLGQQDGINFYRNEEASWYELIAQEQNYYNAQRYFIETNAGDLLLFPSNVKHGVRENSGEFERISLAFNTFFSGEIGKREFSNFLSIKVN